MGFSQKYELITESDGTKVQRQPPGQSFFISWWKLLLCNLLAAVVGASVMFAVVRGPSIIHPSSTPATVAPVSSATPTVCPTPSIEHVDLQADRSNPLTGIILDCGHSPEEAREKGCVYDVMMQDWVPEPCYDEVLTEEYLTAGNWTWYATGEGNVTMSDEQMRKGEHGAAWMSNSYHKAHCVFSWLKIIRALRNDRGISQELLSYDHVLHCKMGALKAASDDQVLGVRAPTNYAKCALYETWLANPIPDKHNSTQKRWAQ